MQALRVVRCPVREGKPVRADRGAASGTAGPTHPPRGSRWPVVLTRFTPGHASPVLACLRARLSFRCSAFFIGTWERAQKLAFEVD
jgi:hypothetical protein